MRRIGQVVGAVLLLLGVFWVGRETDHGLGALWEHWWCPIPLALILLGFAAVLATRDLLQLREGARCGRPRRGHRFALAPVRRLGMIMRAAG
jgi:hypothetical protein